MMHYNLTEWYSGWGWFLWFGIIFLMFSSFGNWGYTYQAHRRYRDFNMSKDAIDLLSERYARGEIDRSEFHSVKNEILEIRTEIKKGVKPKDSKPLRPQTSV